MSIAFHNQELADRAAAYGSHTDGVVVDHTYHEQVSSDTLPLSEVAKRGGRVHRVRLLSEFIPGRGRCVDVSYVHATLADGTMVRVDTGSMPEWSLIPLRRMKGVLIEWAKAEGVFAKGLGLLDEANWSVLR